MTLKQLILTLILLNLLVISGCSRTSKEKITEIIGEDEYSRLMNMSAYDFDQSPDGFRQYSDDYYLISFLIPEYISVNQVSEGKSRNMHWHMGQMHAFYGNYEKAIIEMKQSYSGGTVSWANYVSGSIAFLEKDRVALLESMIALKEQENQMNIEILEKFLNNFDKSYNEAYNSSL
jgi:hypothetical protein